MAVFLTLAEFDSRLGLLNKRDLREGGGRSLSVPETIKLQENKSDGCGNNASVYITCLELFIILAG